MFSAPHEQTCPARPGPRLSSPWTTCRRCEHRVRRRLRSPASIHEPEWFKKHVELEDKSDVIQIYEGQAIPGLLQTEGYARTVFTLAAETPDVERSVRKRMSRQAALTRDNPPRLWVRQATFTYTEAAAGGRLTADPTEVQRMTERFSLIGAEALSRSETRTFLRRAQESVHGG